MNSNKLGSILDKIDDKAELLGGMYGATQYPLHLGFGQFVPQVMSAVRGWKPKDPLWVFNHLMLADPQKTQFMNNIMTGFLGWGVAEFGGMIDPRIAKIGRICKKVGFNAAIFNYLAGFLWFPQHNPAGSLTTGIHTTSPPTGYMSHTSGQRAEPLVGM